MGLFSSGETITLKVTGMTCGGCVNTVQRVLNDVDGVKKVVVNLETHEAKITGKKLNRDALINVVKDANFEAELSS